MITAGSYTYGDTFSNGVGSTPVTEGSQSEGFYDDFLFTVTGGIADSVTTDINLGNLLKIDNLQVALFNYTSGQAVPVGSQPIATGWSQSFNTGSGTTVNDVALPTTTLSPGSYALEVVGTVTGSLGGSYSGTLNLAPVPLPAACPLLLSALGGLGFWSRKRRNGARERPATATLA
jgi:hypothetical protein